MSNLNLFFKNERTKTVIVLLFTVLMIYLATTSTFLSFVAMYPLATSFLKFFVLASIGDVISVKLKSRKWSLPAYMLVKAIIWGLLGILIYMMFQLYPSFIVLLQEKGILPFEGNVLAKAFFISLIMNYTFAPVMMGLHKISDTYLDLRASNPLVTIKEAFNHIEWKNYYNFIVLKTIPFFWIPAHTITFILPKEYRIVFAAVLGIFLGLLLNITKKTT